MLSLNRTRLNKVFIFVVFVVCNSVLQGNDVAKYAMTVGLERREGAGSIFLQAESATEERSLLRIAAGYLSDPLSFDPLVVYFDDRSTLSYDGSFDALKLFNTDLNVTNFFVFSQEGSKLSISGVPGFLAEPLSLKLGIRTEKRGTVIIRVSNTEGLFTNCNVVLQDRVTGSETRLATGLEYPVSLAAGEHYDRFFLIISALVMAVPTMVNETGDLKVYFSGGVLKSNIIIPGEVKGMLEIYNMSGQLLSSYRLGSSGYHEFYPDLVRGNYIIRVYSTTMSISKKIFINPD